MHEWCDARLRSPPHDRAPKTGQGGRAADGRRKGLRTIESDKRNPAGGVFDNNNFKKINTLEDYGCCPETISFRIFP